MKLQVHLIQRFLHVLDMAGRHIDEAGPMSQQRPDSADVLRRTEGCTQQANRMQVLQPLTVGNVRASSRDVLDVLRIHKINLQPASFQNLHQWNPVNPGGFHRNRANAALL